MFTKNGPEFQCLKGQDQNSSLYKIRAEHQCLQRCGENTNAHEKTAKLPMFGRIRSENQEKGLEFQSLEGKGQNSKVHKKSSRIPMCKRINL